MPIRQSNERKPKSMLGFLDEFSLGGIVGFLLVMMFVYYLLLQTNLAFISLNSLLLQIINLPNQEQIIAIVVLPIYLASVVFGSSILGAFLGHWMWPKIIDLIKRLFTNEGSL